MSHLYGSPNRRLQQSPVHHKKSPSYPNRSSGSFYNPTTKKMPVSEFSPQKLTEQELLRQRCYNLETSLTQANNNLELEKYGNRSQHLQLDNDSLQQKYAQKRTEVEIWKNKYDTQRNNLVELKANYEMELQKVSRELEFKNQQIATLSQNKLEENDLLKYTIQEEGKERIEFIKQTHAKNASLYEEQLRKMKDIIESREREIQELNFKINNIRTQGDEENNRINEDRDSLRAKIQQLELELNLQLENQKAKIGNQTDQQILSMKTLHLNEINILESESQKIKRLLEVKNDEIQALINQNKHQKQNYDSEANELKIEISHLQQQIGENNLRKEEEISELKEKLATLHITSVQDLKLKNESLANHLTAENAKLKELIENKSEELNNQIQEKLQQRESYNNEVERLKMEIEKSRLQYLNLQEEKKRDQQTAHANIEDTQLAHDRHTQQLQDHIVFLEKEVNNLKQLIVKKNNDSDRHIARSNTIKSTLEEDNNKLRSEIDEWKQAFQNLEFEKEKLMEENRQKSHQSSNLNTDIQRKLEAKIDFLEQELNKAQENIKVKSEEINTHIGFRNQQESEIRKLKQEIESLQERIVYSENLKIRELEEQRIKLENQNQITCDTLKQSFQNQKYVLESQIENLNKIIEQKDKEIEDMIQKYETLEIAFEEFQKGQGQLEDYEKKLQLLGSEIVTTKNLYDVFVKTKSRFNRRSQNEQQ